MCLTCKLTLLPVCNCRDWPVALYCPIHNWNCPAHRPDIADSGGTDLVLRVELHGFVFTLPRGQQAKCAGDREEIIFRARSAPL